MDNRQIDDTGFWKWFDRQRGSVSTRAVERNGNVPRGRIGNARAGNYKPTFEICQSVAAGLNLPIKDVLKIARLTPPTHPDTEREETLVLQFRKLPVNDQRLLLEMVQALVEKRAKKPRRKKTRDHDLVVVTNLN